MINPSAVTRGHFAKALALALSTLTLVTACGGTTPAPEPPPPELAGSWRAVLSSPGGELPFELRFAEGADGLEASLENGAEQIELSRVELDGRRVTLHFDWYDSEITAELDASGDRLAGQWRKTAAGGGDSTLPFAATRGEAARFLPRSASGIEAGDAAVTDLSGHWRAELTDDDGSEPARVELRQSGAEVEGTFLTPTGDYRFLVGSYEDGLLRLSTFDGAHAFLFQARAQADRSLVGDFWSRDTYHATWTAEPIAAGEEVLPDAWSLAGLTNDEGRFRFAFPDLEGQIVDQDDPRFDGKVVLVNIFGTWCPNCNDEAPLLAEWHRRYAERGLEVVGLAYEFTGQPERDREMLRRFATKYDIGYPLLLAGTNDKAGAAATLPDLDRVVAYPTTVYIGRDGKARRIHSGFSGPGTGAHHVRLVEELEALIETLLDEPVES